MSEIAIRAEGLSKQYRIRAAKHGHDTLRDQLMAGVKSLFRRNGPPRITQETVWAIKDISFEIEQGEVVGIIGRNGAGKSTLLKVLCRITEPTLGRAAIFGRVGSLLEVGTGFDRELSGRENIYLSGAILGMKKAEIDRKFDAIVDFAEVEKFIDTPVKHYSSGMYVRLAFAVAAHLEPEILFVDEVLAVGDAAFQKKCLGKMGTVAREGRTVLFVSHNMAMIDHLCTRAILLRDGTVAEDGPTSHIVDAYRAEIADLPATPLRARGDRTGAGEIVATALQLVDTRGYPCSYGRSGERLIVRLYYVCNIARVFRRCRLSVSVHKDEHVFFLLSTELVDTTQLDLEGAGYVDLIVPELPLSAGEYYLNCFIESNGIIQDWVIGAAALSIIDGDFYGTGRNYPPGWQGKCVLVKHFWEQGHHRSA